MTVKFSPSNLNGKAEIPPSKSISHRALICAALSEGTSIVDNVILSQDIIATMKSLEAIGASFDIQEHKISVTGIHSNVQKAMIDCNESGSTLRFMIPVVAALGIEGVFVGKGKLPERPITPYLSELTKNGIQFDYRKTMPFGISGKLLAGEFCIDGNISSQFITGLLFALPLLDGDSVIKINGKLESKPYVDLTIEALNAFGVEIVETSQGYYIKGRQKYKAAYYRVDGDYSQAAFFMVAAALGGKIECIDVSKSSRQGDKEIVDILKRIGADVIVTDNGVIIEQNKLNPFSVDVTDIPDLVPILTVLACFCEGKSTIYGAARLRLKESDRLKAISECLNALGAKVTAFNDKLEITGVEKLLGGKVDSFNDHRIAMSVAVASVKGTEQITLTGAQSVNKSYPDFYEDFKALGGIADVIHVE
ncbi:MAG: aroA [Oscillospiraceae bacterium]|nr:aroA [Oscillospiraceae bacterium]